MDEVIGAKDMIQALEETAKNDYSWEGTPDAFKSVRDLYDGDTAIVQKEDYYRLKDVDATVKSKLSIVDSDDPWLFLATRGTGRCAPQWYFIDSDDHIYTEFPEICRALRERLGVPEIIERPWDQTTEDLLNKYREILHKKETLLLPNKRRRALQVAQFVLEKQLAVNKDANKDVLYRDLLELFKGNSLDDEYVIDYYGFSQQWLDVFNPYLYERRQDPKIRNRVISLNDLKHKDEALKVPMSADVLKRLIDNVPYVQSTWFKVAACIIGVPSKADANGHS